MDNLYLVDLIVLVINWHVSILGGTIRGDPQETLYRVRYPILVVCLVIFVGMLYFITGIITAGTTVITKKALLVNNYNADRTSNWWLVVIER